MLAACVAPGLCTQCISELARNQLYGCRMLAWAWASLYGSILYRVSSHPSWGTCVFEKCTKQKKEKCKRLGKSLQFPFDHKYGVQPAAACCTKKKIKNTKREPMRLKKKAPNTYRVVSYRVSYAAILSMIRETTYNGFWYSQFERKKEEKRKKREISWNAPVETSECPRASACTRTCKHTAYRTECAAAQDNNEYGFQSNARCTWRFCVCARARRAANLFHFILYLLCFGHFFVVVIVSFSSIYCAVCSQ